MSVADNDKAAIDFEVRMAGQVRAMFLCINFQEGRTDEVCYQNVF